MFVRTKSKKFLAIFLSISLLASLVSFATIPASAAIITAVVDSGAIGPGLEYETVEIAAQSHVYPDIYSALAAIRAENSSGCTLKLNENVTITEPVTFYTSGSGNLNMNGYSITYSPDVDGEFYNTPAFTYYSSYTGHSQVSLQILTTTKAQDAITPRSDIETGTFVNNSGSKYFFYQTGELNGKSDTYAAFSFPAGAEYTYYGDITLDGRCSGASNNNKNIMGDLIVSKLLSPGSANFYIHGNIECKELVSASYGYFYVYGYIYASTLNFNQNFTTYLVKKGTSTPVDTYNGYHVYSEGNIGISIGNSAKTFAGDFYAAGNVTISQNASLTAARAMVLSGKLDTDGSLTINAGNTNTANSFKTTWTFNKPVSIGQELKIIDNVGFGVVFKDNVYVEKCLNYPEDKVTFIKYPTTGGGHLFVNGVCSNCSLIASNENEFVLTSQTTIPAAGSKMDNDKLFVALIDVNGDIITPGTTVNPGIYTALGLGIEMAYGAQVRLKADSNGIRFITAIDKADYDLLKLKAISVETGTRIAPTDLITPEYDGYNNAIATGFYAENDSVYLLAGSIASIKETNINREFTGQGYVKFNFGADKEVTIYSNQNDNSRSIFNIATLALSDVRSALEVGYEYEVTLESDIQFGKFSPYNQEQRAILQAYIN